MNNNGEIILNVLEKDKTPVVRTEAEEINFKDVDVVINVPPGDKNVK